MRLDPDAVAARIGQPLAQWPGHCYAIACALVDAGLVPGGAAVYGAFWGRIAPGTLFDDAFYRGLGCVRHGWVQVGRRVVDPTRYVFEGKAPFIYEGPAGADYDRGANRLRVTMSRPPPAFDATEPWVELDLRASTRSAVARWLGDPHPLTRRRAFWLVNLPLPRLGPHAEPLYRAFVRAGYAAWIPWDNRCAVLGADETSGGPRSSSEAP